MKKTGKLAAYLLAFSLLFLFSCEKEEDDVLEAEPRYTDVMADDLKSNLVDDASISPYAAIIDVSPYFQDGHVPFATNAGSVDGLGDMLAELDNSKTYLVYCHADAPSIAGAELMVENGFSKVHRLKGNFSAWDNVSFLDINAEEVNARIGVSDFEAIFDVSPYYAQGHLPGATNAKASAGGTDLSELIVDLDKNKLYLVYCHANGPSMAGAQLMEDAGFSNVYRLEGNYSAWVNGAYPIEQ